MSRSDTIVRRALLAGGGTAVTIGGILAVGLSGGGGAASAAGAWMGIAVGGLVTAGWLLAAWALDVIAGERPPRGRLLWTAGTTALALLLPLVALAAGAADGA